jgi:NADH-quinone oxidoreductase subunit H
MKNLFYYTVFPGFLFTVTLGFLSSWLDRKVTARVQWRVGPPLLQPVYDVIKLLGKEIIIPQGAPKFLFLMLPLVGLASAILVSTMNWLSMLDAGSGFVGDWIVVIYLLAVPAIMLILGSFASANPLASVGGSREIKLLLGYELPFVMACLVPVIKAHSIKLGEIIAFQASSGILLSSVSGVAAFIIALLCIQAKLGLVPFDMAEAETEIMAGAYIEFSGAVLAVFKLTKFIMLVASPLFLVVLFMGSEIKSIVGFLFVLLKYILVVVLLVLIRNTNPRVKIDQAVRFFWGPITALAVTAIILAMIGL